MQDPTNSDSLTTHNDSTLSTNVSRTETAVESDNNHDIISNKPLKAVTLMEGEDLYPPSRRATRESTSGGLTGDFQAPSLKRRFTNLMIPERKVKREPTYKVSYNLIFMADRALQTLFALRRGKERSRNELP